MLKVLNASKAYGDHQILNQVSFTLTPGQIVALAGPSGSGKSTLLRCIQNLEKLDGGTIACKGSTGFIFQDFQLFAHLNIVDNVAYALRVTKKLGMESAQHKAKDTLKQLGIKSAYTKMPHQVSGGQRQRIAIARALVLEPDLLLCDEPTSGLDGLSGKNVAELFLNLKSQGVTMLIASHDLDFISAVADRVIVLKDAAMHKDIDISGPLKQKLCWTNLLG